MTAEEILEKLEGDLSIAGIIELQNNAQSLDELNAITEFGNAFADENLRRAVDAFNAGTRRFLNVTERILKLIDQLDSRFTGISPDRDPAAAPVLEGLIARLSEVLRLFHDDEGMRTTHTSNQEVEDLDNDEQTGVPPVVDTVPVPPNSGEFLHGPSTINSRKFEELADEYVRFFLAADYKNDRKALVRKLSLKALENRGRYEAVGNDLAIPWWFIAVIHLLESTYNFRTHLHNGDRLDARTFRVPSGRPKTGNPPFSWEDSARDALRHHELANLEEWSLPRALWRLERYNGFGYRSKRIATPYLWSFSTIYKKGKFIGDGVFKRSAVSKQCGCATVLKFLHEENHIDLGLDIVGDDETNNADSDSDATVVVDGNQPNIDNNVPPAHPFQAFFGEKLPDIRHFEWHEFLVKGGSHSPANPNSDPPENLWENVLPLVRVLDAFREQVGLPVVLTSVYRSPQYNRRIGGATRSQHMAFTAADFKVVGAGAGSTGQWAERMRQIRSSGLFSGGIGTYRTFVHVDVRGTNANWDQR